MATKEASSSKKPAAASSGKSTGKPVSNLSAKAAAAAIRIADNKKATFNYHIEERFEAGMVLEGWEVKSVREGKVQLTDGYVVIRNGELFIIGCQINPLGTASTHIRPDSIRTKKLLMHKDEIRRLIGKTEQKGFTLVPLNMHWKAGKVKCEIGLAKGKAEHDKRDTIKDREGKREVDRAMKSRNR
ncbi:MAG: SsrA-binding protein SmpB [Polaromonas sp.]|nr:SsrA-binding protein SmpB [Polaromonas sp.]